MNVTFGIKFHAGDEAKCVIMFRLTANDAAAGERYFLLVSILVNYIYLVTFKLFLYRNLIMNDLLIRSLEWESFDFPLKLTSLTAQNNYYRIPFDGYLTVSRDIEYKLTGRLEGQVANKNDLEYQDASRQLEDGHIIKGETIIATEPTHHELSGCYIGTSRYDLIKFQENPLMLNFDSSLGLENIKEIISDEEPARLIEWFLTGEVKLLFPRRTKRMRTDRLTKIRDIDLIQDDFTLHSQSSSRDYFLIDTGAIKCIAQLTPKSTLPNWAHGISIEYLKEYGIPNQETRMAIAEVVGFVLGTQLLNVGSTELDADNGVLKRRANNPYGNNVKAKCDKVALAPVKFTKTEGIKVEAVINEILPNYLKLREPLNLSDILWKYWTAKDLAIGTNLPILSSALESLGDKYLDHHKLHRKFSENEKNEYASLIANEVNSLEGKLSTFPLKESVLNKLRYPFNLGVGEKMRLFFSHLGFNFDKKSVENDALRSRNTMTHSSKSVTDEQIPQAVKMTRAYETLFNRSFLKVLSYTGKYIDYASYGHPERELTENIGEYMEQVREKRSTEI